MSAERLRVNCPTCGKPVVRAPDEPAPYFPFCCRRCKLVDLGKWFTGEHRIEEPIRPEGNEADVGGEPGAGRR